MNIEALLDRYPGVSYLRERARRRIPHFAWEYLDSGTGVESLLARNRTSLDAVKLTPRFMRGKVKPELKTGLFGRDYAAPFGIAPIGLTGLMWPGGELMLARAGRDYGIAYCMSTLVCETPEEIGAIAGGNAWFQLYALANKALQWDILDRVRDAGFSALVLTVDVPVNSTRERQRKAGMREGASGAGRILQAISKPAWALATARHGAPRFRMFDKYGKGALTGSTSFLAGQRIGETGLDHVKEIRDRWKGPLAVKGILDPADAEICRQIGMEGIAVSNHGARQFDAAPSAIEALPQIAAAVGGKMTVMMDGGIRTGLDIARALALGADYMLCGRAFMYGICALGEDGAGLVARMLQADLENNMIQAGAATVAELRNLLAN